MVEQEDCASFGAQGFRLDSLGDEGTEAQRITEPWVVVSRKLLLPTFSAPFVDLVTRLRRSGERGETPVPSFEGFPILQGLLRRRERPI